MLFYRSDYICHEVTSPQALQDCGNRIKMLRPEGIPVRPTTIHQPGYDHGRLTRPVDFQRHRVDTHENAGFRIDALAWMHPKNGIIRGSQERGLTLPGMTPSVVIPHFTTHRQWEVAFGTSEVENEVLASQTYSPVAAENNAHHSGRRTGQRVF